MGFCRHTCVLSYTWGGGRGGCGKRVRLFKEAPQKIKKLNKNKNAIKHKKFVHILIFFNIMEPLTHNLFWKITFLPYPWIYNPCASVSLRVLIVKAAT